MMDLMITFIKTQLTGIVLGMLLIVVVKKNINDIASSIQWCYDNIEQSGGTSPTYVICSNVLKALILQQEENWKNCGSIMHLGADLHKGAKRFNAPSQQT
jgi:hypothetical protein